MSSRSTRWVRAGKVAAAALIAILAIHIFIMRPWYFRWGANDSDTYKLLPGDRLIPTAVHPSTRAVTVRAPASSIWPWIAQLGQDRGGFYSYTVLENLFRADMHNADRIVPEFQDRNVGDVVWLANRNRYGGRGRLIVAEYMPNQYMVLISPEDADRIRMGGFAVDFVWAFVLDPIDANTTRLIVRSSGATPDWVTRMTVLTFWEPAHFIMERKMMLGIKERAEGALTPRLPDSSTPSA